MTREKQAFIRQHKANAATLIRYANPKSRKKPTLEEVRAILNRQIPFVPLTEKPTITSITVTGYSKNSIIKSARFEIQLDNGKMYKITAFEDVKDVRTQEEKELDRLADYPSGMFKIFRDEILQSLENENREGLQS